MDPRQNSWLIAPDAPRERLGLFVRTLLALVAIEWSARRHSPVELCRRAGIEFAGFGVPQQQQRKLNLHVAHRWWAVEAVLRRWPWARDRQCLRRSLLLGRQLRHLSPSLCLEVVSVSPFAVHAWLQAGGHRLDMGDAGTIVRSMSEGVT